MKRIYKYKLKDGRGVEMPIGAKVLTIQKQNGLPYIWALVDTDAECDFRYFEILNKN